MTDNVFTKQELIKFEQLVRCHWPRPQGDGLEAIDHDRWTTSVSTLIEAGALDVTQAVISDTRGVHLAELQHIAVCGRPVALIPGGRGIFIGAHAIARECHAAAVLHYLVKPEKWQIWSGFTDGHHFHSWLVRLDGTALLEPTLIIRERYYGAPVADPVACVRGEQENLAQLHEDGLIPMVFYRRFEQALEQYLKVHTFQTT